MFRRLTALSLVVLFALAVMPASAQQLTPTYVPHTIVVTNLNCKGPGSLRQAISDAYPTNDPNGDTITFAVKGTISKCGTFFIDRSMTIIGPGPKSSDLVLDAGGSRVIDAGATLNLSMVTLTGGNANSGGGLFIHAGTTVHAKNVTFEGNTAFFSAAALYNEGTALIDSSTFHTNYSKNEADPAGGTIIINDRKASLTILNSTVLGDPVDPNIPNTIIENGGTLNLISSVVQTSPAFNPDPYGCAKFKTCPIITASAIENYAAAGGQVFVQNSIIAGFDAVPNCSGQIIEEYRSLQFPGNSCGVNMLVGDPKLGPLQDNGGPTFTMALLPGSAAIGKSTDNWCQGPDQRGFALPKAATTCDIGPFQTVSSPNVTSPSATTTSPSTATAN